MDGVGVLEYAFTIDDIGKASCGLGCLERQGGMVYLHQILNVPLVAFKITHADRVVRIDICDFVDHTRLGWRQCDGDTFGVTANGMPKGVWGRFCHERGGWLAEKALIVNAKLGLAGHFGMMQESWVMGKESWGMGGG